jgi:menaquinone-specific isochorismate synthase
LAIGFLKRPDGKWAVGLGEGRWEASAPADQPAFYAPDFFLSNSSPWLVFDEFSIRNDLSLPVEAQSLRFEEPSRDSFLNRAQNLLDSIAREEIRKAVPVEFEVADFSSDSLPISKLPHSPQLFPYGFWLEIEGMLGATPEILLRLEGQHLETMALAGTAALTAPSLLENPKERHEHNLVIEDIHSSLSAYGDVEVGETKEKILPTLKHLFTPIQVSLKEKVSAETLVKALHPTAALGGFPRAAAKDWLTKQPEASVRRRFGAPFGYVDGDSALFVVAIRNIQRFDEKIWLGSGCGIVTGSDPEREWEELKLKRQSVREMLGLS